MSCRLVQNIKHTTEYNAGGIKKIYLLDVEDFVAYQFQDNVLFGSCMVESIKKKNPFIELDTVNESNFSENCNDGIYKQELTSYIRGIKGPKTDLLLRAGSNRYIVVFETYTDQLYTFGTDGGAKVSFSQQTGQMGNASGYNITISKNSIYPLFEVNESRFSTGTVLEVLGTENKANFIATEDGCLVLV